jgi:hypothetical protein
MPYSSHQGLTLALEHAARLRPRRILDVGSGFGKWGFLLREELDFIDGRVERDEWEVTIDAIDARRYDTPLSDWVYNEVRMASVLDVSGELGGYDLVVLGDVIEHFEKADGLSLLGTLLGQNRNVLLTTPFLYFEQEIAGNPYQRHLSHWTIDDFRPWTFDYDVVGGFLVVVLLAGQDADRPQRADTRASRIAYGLPFLRSHGSAARVVKSLVRSLG